MPHLVDRFYQGGLYNSPYEEIVHYGPQRQETLIKLAEQSIQLQRKAAQDIARSQIEAADRVAAEVRQQTADLERMVAEQGDQLAHSISDAAEWISGSIGAAADQVSGAIFALAERLGIELAEIRWQMEQANLSLSDILKTLQLRRRTEASELVQQGVRHSVHGEYGEAEERFLLALKLDSTDYQVLMNLGYIEVHKDNGAEAIRFFDKASKLPPPEILSAEAKAEALWARARVHYAQRQYAEALQYGTQALSAASYPDWVFGVGVYAALAGDPKLALRRIEEAIQQSPDLFVRAATDPDLHGIRKRVWEQLGNLAVETARLVDQRLMQAKQGMNGLPSKVEHQEYQKYVQHLSRALNAITARLQKPSYVVRRQAVDDLNWLIEAVEEATANGKQDLQQKEEQQQLETTCEKLELDYKKLAQDHEKRYQRYFGNVALHVVESDLSKAEAKDGPGPFVDFMGLMILSLFITYPLTGIAIYIKFAGSAIMGYIEGVLYSALWIFPAIFDDRHDPQLYHLHQFSWMSAAIFFVVVTAILFIVWRSKRTAIESKRQMIQTIREQRINLGGKYEQMEKQLKLARQRIADINLRIQKYKEALREKTADLEQRFFSSE